jgi:antitoxin (DNA-binding transcriptional repressor) of toxin-antitoxin stability system
MREQVRITVRGRPVADIVPAAARAGNGQTLRQLDRPRRARRQAIGELHAALLIFSAELTLATWDVRLHRAAQSQGLAVFPAQLP